MAFNVNQMIKRGLESGVAKTSHFEVQIVPPRALGVDSNRDELLLYRADSVEIPGRTALTIDQRFTVNGPINKVPYAQVYPDVTVTFLLSEDFREKEYIDNWMSKMMDTRPGIDSFGSETGAFNVKYFDDYKSTINIKQFDMNGTLRTTTKLIDAYPIILNGVQMAWGDDSLAKISCQFTLRYYTVEKHAKVTEKNESEEVVKKSDTNLSATVDQNKPILVGFDQREATISPSNRVFTGLASGQ